MARINEFSALAARRPATGPMRRIGNMVDTLWLWRSRARSRAHLAQLDEHLLRDIGIDRSEREQEVEKPFWQP